jgi:hypothetical protein
MSLTKIAAHALLAAITVAAAVEARADKFLYRDEKGQSRELEARLVASQGGIYVLERADGQYVMVPRSAAIKREASPGPEPLDADAMLAGLRTQFGDSLFRGIAQPPYVVGLVLAAPLPRNGEGRANSFLRSTAAFMKNVDGAFGTFLKDARIAAQAPTHPLVVLVFEGLADFRKYETEVSGGTGPSARAIAGFYSPRTNYLAVRLDECRTFEIVLHEATHQQSFNRNLLNRLAPIPAWFAEGIATGFEANQGKIRIGPGKICPRYASKALAAKQIDWDRLLIDDTIFSHDALLSDAYGLAWGLHWLTVTKYKSEYSKYLRLLAEKNPLEQDNPLQRREDFETAFGKKVTELGKEFRQTLEAGMKRQKTVMEPPKLPAGLSETNQNLGTVDLSALRSGADPLSPVQVKGTLMNLSPLRAMTFRVVVVTDAGSYAEWLIPSLEMGKSTYLLPQTINKAMAGFPAVAPGNPGAAGGGPHTFRVHIHSAPPESAEATQWRSGQLPAPTANDP